MALIECPKIQEDINNNFIQGDPTAAKEPIGFTEFVVSDVNTSGFLQRKVDSGNGKLRKVELLYQQPILESEVAATSTRLCTTANEAGMLSTTYELGYNEGVSHTEKISMSELAIICQENPLYLGKRIQAIMDVLVKAIATNNATTLATLNGAFGTGDLNQDGSVILLNDKVVSTKKADGSIDIGAYEEIKYSSMNAGYPTIPFVFGFGEIYKYMTRVDVGCCANDGLDIGAYAMSNQLVFMADKKVQTAFGANKFVGLAAGATQWLSWLEYAGPRGINMIDTENYKQTVVTDPKTGFQFDFTLTNDCGDWIINLKLANKLVGLPADLYGAGDAFEDVTFVNKYTITNP
jgi:hypothetical protein